MIASYLIAKNRIKSGNRPSFVGAWGPVLIDWLAVLAVLAPTWEPSVRFIDAMQPGTGAIMLYFFALYFVPMQLVIIFAAMWAARSRWQDADPQR